MYNCIQGIGRHVAELNLDDYHWWIVPEEQVIVLEGDGTRRAELWKEGVSR